MTVRVYRCGACLTTFVTVEHCKHRCGFCGRAMRRAPEHRAEITLVGSDIPAGPHGGPVRLFCADEVDRYTDEVGS